MVCRLVKLQRPPPEISIFLPIRLAWSSRTTRQPLRPAWMAQKGLLRRHPQSLHRSAIRLQQSSFVREKQPPIRAHLRTPGRPSAQDALAGRPGSVAGPISGAAPGAVLAGAAFLRAARFSWVTSSSLSSRVSPGGTSRTSGPKPTRLTFSTKWPISSNILRIRGSCPRSARTSNQGLSVSRIRLIWAGSSLGPPAFRAGRVRSSLHDGVVPALPPGVYRSPSPGRSFPRETPH